MAAKSAPPPLFSLNMRQRNRGVFTPAFIQSSIGFAVLAGAGVGVFISSELSPEALESWGWRIPFILGLLIGPVGWFIRRSLDETPTFKNAARSDTPLREVVREFPRQTFATISLVILWTVMHICLVVLHADVRCEVAGIATSARLSCRAYWRSGDPCCLAGIRMAVGPARTSTYRRMFGAADRHTRISDVCLHCAQPFAHISDALSNRFRNTYSGVHGAHSRRLCRDVP